MRIILKGRLFGLFLKGKRIPVGGRSVIWKQKLPLVKVLKNQHALLSLRACPSGDPMDPASLLMEAQTDPGPTSLKL